MSTPPPPVQGAVQMQPYGGPQGQTVSWMEKPESPLGCPPGLEYLAQIDQILIKQQVELLELITGWETANKYRILNSVGQQIYFAQEESGVCMRQCCGPNRGFVMHITDNFNQEVMRITREFKCCTGCCWCAGCCDHCAFEVQIEAPVGQVVGYTKQLGSSWKPKYAVMDANRDTVGIIEGPCCVCNCPCCGDVDFPVYSADKQVVIGKVAKQWTGALKEFFTDADTFGITFPVDMDVKLKACMMGACFLIDFMFFEHQQNNN